MNIRKFSTVATFVALATTQGLALAGPISFKEALCKSGTVTVDGLKCSTSASGVSYSATQSAWSAKTGAKFSKASMVYFNNSGFGVKSPGESTSSPNHAMDNSGATEAILINFSSKNFALDQLSIGWRQGDADVSILRYTGTQAPVLGGRTVNDLKSAAGWEFVGDYSTLGTSMTMNFNNTGDVKTAAWWLVSAYNSGYSGKAARGALTNGNDYFKFSGFGGHIVAPAAVPEPATFALFALGILGVAAARRKATAK